MHLSSSVPTWMPAQLPFCWRWGDCTLTGWWNDKQILLLWEVRASDLCKGSAQLLRTARTTLQGVSTTHWFCITFRLTSEKSTQISNKVQPWLPFFHQQTDNEAKDGDSHAKVVVFFSRTLWKPVLAILQNTKQNATQAADDSTDTFKHDNWQKPVKWFALKPEK